MWKYAGFPAPRSIIIPHLLTVRTRTGSFVLPQGQDASSSSSTTTNDDSSDSQSSSLHLRFRRSVRRTSAPKAVAALNSAVASFLSRYRVQFVRCWFQWNFFEKYIRHRELQPGQDLADNYQFPLDDFVSKMNEKGISVIGVLGNGYSRFLPFGLQNVDNLEVYLRRLDESSTAIVRHYKDSIKAWQIENEPNWWKAHYAGHWRSGSVWLDSSNQEPILETLHRVVRSESPDSTIIINLEADNENTDWKFYAKYCDIMGLDFYPNYKHPIPSDATMICNTSKLVRRETGLPTFVVETGYPTGPWWLGYSESKQAKYVRSACEQAFSCDAISGLGWFRFSDSYWRSFPFHENYFGLLTKGGRPKLGWWDYVNQIKNRR